MDDTETATVRLPLAVVGAFGVATAAAIAAAPALGGILAAVHLVGLVGWPLSASFGAVVRSRLNRAALSVVFSLAVSALSFQSLYWFGFAAPVAVVALATIYGLALGWLVPSGNRTYGWRAGGAI